MADSTDGKLYATLAQTPTHGHRHILYGRDSFDENDRPESRHGVEAQITAVCSSSAQARVFPEHEYLAACHSHSRRGFVL